MGKEEAIELESLGYRVISLAHKTVARVDRPDWKAYMRGFNHRPNADLYRRCISKDRKVVSLGTIRAMQNSEGDKTGYIDPNKSDGAEYTKEDMRLDYFGCIRKTVYPNLTAAIKHSQKRKCKMRAYKCRRCGKYHLTAKGNMRGKRNA